MAIVELGGVRIAYELVGDGGAPCVAITPAGRFGMDVPGVRELSAALAGLGKRVLIWDRPNCGASDICLVGPSESDLQGKLLTELIRALDLGPTALAGGSSGARTCLRAAVHDPGIVSHLVLWWVSGGTISLQLLGAGYYGEAAVASRLGGMDAVAKTAPWAELIAGNPRNRDILFSRSADEFLGVLERWAEAFVPSPDMPIPGMTGAELAQLTMPVLIFAGHPCDLVHPPRMTALLHELLPHSVLADLPWSNERFVEVQRQAAQGGSHLVDWPLLASPIAEFTT